MIFQDSESVEKLTYAAKKDVYEIKKEVIRAWQRTRRRQSSPND